MDTDAFVIRHSRSHAPHFIHRHCEGVIINAGDGSHEHPTQALLDTFTLYERWHVPGDESGTGFEGKHVVIVGDIRHSRVANSNILACQKLGATVEVCGPATLIPRGIESLGVAVSHDIDEALPRADAVIMLRMQFERQNHAYVPSLAEYIRYFGLKGPRHAAGWRHDVPILHPGPVNRDVELDSAMADSQYSLILDQVRNGVFIRMAVLELLLGNVANDREPIAVPG
jgi:aspartate carbamoyltransferase catalytic subunit